MGQQILSLLGFGIPKTPKMRSKLGGFATFQNPVCYTLFYSFSHLSANPRSWMSKMKPLARHADGSFHSLGRAAKSSIPVGTP